MKKTVFVVAAFVSLACAIAVCSQGRPGANMPPAPGEPMMSCPAMATMMPHADMINRMAKSLKLTHTQSVNLKNVTAKSDKALRSLRQASSKASQSLRAAMLASKYNAKNVKSLAAKAEKAEARVIAANVDEWSQIRSILTVNQVKKLQATTSMQRPFPGRRPAGPPIGMNGFMPRRSK